MAHLMLYSLVIQPFVMVKMAHFLIIPLWKNMLIFHSYLELPEATETKQTETVRKAGWGGRMKTTSRGNGWFCHYSFQLLTDFATDATRPRGCDQRLQSMVSFVGIFQDHGWIFKSRIRFTRFFWAQRAKPVPNSSETKLKRDYTFEELRRTSGDRNNENGSRTAKKVTKIFRK